MIRGEKRPPSLMFLIFGGVFVRVHPAPVSVMDWISHIKWEERGERGRGKQQNKPCVGDKRGGEEGQ